MNNTQLFLARRRVLAVSVAAFPAAVLAACGQAAAPNSGTSGTARKELVVAPPLTQLDQLVATINRAAPMAEFLKKEASTEVKAYAPGDYSGTMLGLKDGSIDFGFLPAILFLRAQDDSGAQPLFKTVRPGVDNKPVPAFTSIIAVRADSGINSIADMKGKHIVAIDVSDAAGWVLPAAHAKKNGVDPNRDAKVEYRKDGPDALLQLLNKKADVAFAAKNDLQDAAVLKADPEAAKTLKILATIENAPLEVVAARRGLDAKVVDTFKGAFRALGDPQKGTFTKDGKTQPILGQWGISGLVDAKDGDFAALREAGKAIGIRLK